MMIPQILLALIIAAIVTICILCVIRKENFDREAFNQKWPLITEEEFLAACPPGTDRVIALRVRKIVSEQLGVAYERLHPSMRFVEDLGA